VSAERAGYIRKSYRNGLYETFSALTLTTGQHLSGIELELTRTVTISGKVLDDGGDPVANVPVQVVRRAARPGVSPGGGHVIYTDESGRYSISGLEAGRYYPSAGTGGMAFSIRGMRAVNEPAAETGTLQAYYTNTFYPDVTNPSLAKAIQIVAGQDDLEGVNIRLRKTDAFLVGGKIVGTIPGYPLDKCRVSLALADQPLSANFRVTGTIGHIANDGAIDFRGLRFPPGDYSIMVSADLMGLPIILARQELTIRDRDIDNAVINLQQLVEVRGSVALEGEQQTNFRPLFAGRPAAITMQVGLMLSGNPVSNLRANVADDGSFRIAGVPAGRYEVRPISTPDRTWVKSVRLGSLDAQDSMVEISSATNTGPLQITLSRGVSEIDGFVETDRGGPAARSTVTLVGDPSGSGRVSMLSGVGDNGRFFLTPVPPGTYRLYAWEDIKDANQFGQGLLEARASDGARVTVKGNGVEQVTLRQIPSTHGLH
jgi:Carboxypeptidase regulatory-like domain